MTLREFGVSENYLVSLGVRNGRCPFHRDYKPSAYLNANNIYCFTCSKTYSLSEIRQRFNIQIAWAENSSLSAPPTFEESYGYKPFEVLFSYNFDLESPSSK